MNKNCALVRDLMPLYLDGVCSDESGRVVEDHLKECSDCRDLYGRMQSYELETVVHNEKEEVLRRQEGFFKRRSAVVGTVIAGIFMIPILICLIVNLATGHGLSWFFIVFFALLLAASLTVVPLIVPENKGLWTLGTFTVSLLLLLGVCALYTHKHFFFTAAAGILFGLALVFLPFVIRTKPVKALNIPCKGLLVMAVDTFLFVVLLFAACLQAKAPGAFGRALAVALPFWGVAWILFLILYIAKCGRLIKAGIVTIAIGTIGLTAEMIVNGILGLAVTIPVFTPFVWTAGTIDGNVKWIIFFGCALIGIILILAGIIRGMTGRKRTR